MRLIGSCDISRELNRSNCLERDNHNVARGALALRCRLDALVVTKRDMHDATLVRSHRAKLHAAMLLGSLCGSITSDGLELLSLTILVASTSTITG